MRTIALATCLLTLAAQAQDEGPLSPASRGIATSLKEPVKIRAYFGGHLPEGVAPVQRRALDILAQYESISGGKLKVDLRDPQEDFGASREATADGVRPREVLLADAAGGRRTETVWGSIVVTCRDRASRPFDVTERYPQGEEGLEAVEFEISSRIWQITHDRPRIGVGGHLAREARAGGPARPEFDGIRKRLREAFDVVDVDLDREGVDPAKVPLLVLLRPREMDEAAVFRLDQYLMGGGRVLLFLTQGTMDILVAGRIVYTPFRSGLDAWLDHHGLRVPNEFVLHLHDAQPVPVERLVDTPRGRVVEERPEPNWFWPVFGKHLLARDMPLLRRRSRITLFWTHPVDVVEGNLGTKRATVLLRSDAAQSWRWKDPRRIERRDLSETTCAPARTDLRSSPVAVALEGKFASSFADREGAIPRSALPTALVVVGSAVAMSDSAIGKDGARAEEITPLGLDLVEWLSLPPELIALRGREGGR